MEKRKGMDRLKHMFNGFVLGTMARDNKYLNRIFWMLIAAGPLIAIGILSGTFTVISYTDCAIISGVAFAVALFHYVMVKRHPDSPVAGVVSLVVIDCLIAYLAYGNVPLTLTWYLVPLLSILLCNRGIYLGMTLFNFALMAATTWFAAERDLFLARNFHSVMTYFVDKLGGYSIEVIFMFVSGLILINLVEAHYNALIREQKTVKDQEAENEEKVAVLDSMAEIYDNVNLIDFTEKTEMSLRDRNHVKHVIDLPRQTHTLMNQRIRDNVMPDQFDRFWEFTDITTVPERLTGKKIISADFIDVVSGWFRAQYITVEATAEGVPTVVIYTIRNVDEEKQREERLIRVAMTDELTRLYNRRSFEEDLTELRKQPLPEDFVMFSFDVNGLKTVNDTLGHAAGDELIKGAADCLVLSVGSLGKVYRTGGDEFMAILYTDDPDRVCAEISMKTGEWRGVHCEALSLSVGYAALANYPDHTVDDLERVSDAAMYADKERHYLENGIDRRRR